MAKINMKCAQKTVKLLLERNRRTYYNFRKEINCKNVYRVVFIQDKEQRARYCEDYNDFSLFVNSNEFLFYLSK